MAGRRADRRARQGRRVQGWPAAAEARRHPLPHRQRLSAFQLFRRGQRPHRLQRRRGPRHLPRAGGRLRHPGARLGRAAAGAAARRGRRRHRLARGQRQRPEGRRFHRPLLPHARPLCRQARPGRLDVTPEGLEGKKIAVTKGTAHEAYLRAFFRDSSIRAFEIAGAGPRCADQRRGRSAVRRRHQPGLLAQRHGVQGLLRVQGRAVRRAQVLRRRRRHGRQPRGPAAQDADQRGPEALRESGRFEELVLRYFPLRAF